MAPRPAKKAAAANPSPKKEKAGGAKSKQTTPKVDSVPAVTVEAEALKQSPTKPNGAEAAPEADIASAKSNVLKLIVPAVKKCMLPSTRPGDSAASVMCRGLSMAAVKYRPEDDSLIQDDRERRQASEISPGDWPNILEGK